ncbi:hypothetical protein THZG08_530013 [Vibrio owensii]|nr:hypothetical protein THZG08_530013 [Vibrio owensii]CAH1584901.1 hypothetical protein THOA03_530013 [Vibrio owensii]
MVCFFNMPYKLDHLLSERPHVKGQPSKPVTVHAAALEGIIYTIDLTDVFGGICL